VNIHASVVALGALGILILGRSGSGKTSLALAAIEKLQSQNHFAALVADDQCLIEAANDKLVATCPPALVGLIEMRGLGVVKTKNLSSVVIDFVIQIVDEGTIERMPQQKFANYEGIELPVFELPARQIAVSLPILMQIAKDRRF
jgi:serine kinase of HPr protein (carbohydrate metabolism regulator)